MGYRTPTHYGKEASARMTPSVIAPPQTYADWMSIFTLLKDKSDDELVLQAMQKGTITWQSGVAERFMKKLIDAINFRMNQATDQFQKEITRSYGQERVIVRALLALRRELQFLTQVANIPAIPEQNRQKYIQLILDQADHIQHSLEDSSRSDRSGKLRSIIRTNPVNRLTE